MYASPGAATRTDGHDCPAAGETAGPSRPVQTADCASSPVDPHRCSGMDRLSIPAAQQLADVAVGGWMVCVFHLLERRRPKLVADAALGIRPVASPPSAA